MNKQKMLDQLANIPVGRLQSASFKAVLRLHVYFTGLTHQAMLDFGARAQAILLMNANSDGTLATQAALQAQTQLLTAWSDAWAEWRGQLFKARSEAARIAFGVQAVSHDRVVRPVVIGNEVTESLALQESSIVDGVYDPQLRILLDAAENYLYGDGMTLSGRLWRIDRETRDGINAVLMSGITKGDSAWTIARNLEQYLGAGADCPRWTTTRLYGRTKSEIAAGDATGLLRGDACVGSGVSYNALRVARTEIQKIHSLATDRMMRQQPWIEKEKVNLSAAHPEHDICDETVEGGEDGEGIYPVGTINLPLHPNCLCYKTAVMMDRDQFTSQLKGWLNGGSFPEMDEYAQNLGVDLNTSLAPAAVNLAVWMFGEDLKL